MLFRSSAAADVTIRGSRTGEGLGGTCTLGDMDGDGKADLTVFASEATLWAMLGARGTYLVFYGRDSWPRVLEAGTDSDFVITSSRLHSSAGPALLADVNGDHYDDLVVSWPLDHTKGREDPDEVQIWFGGARRKGTLPATAADVSIHSTEPKLGFGGALAARDFDGDGIPDLVVSEPRRASLYLLYGRKDWKIGRAHV